MVKKLIIGTVAVVAVLLVIGSAAGSPAATPNPNATTVVNTAPPASSQPSAPASVAPSAAAVKPIVLLKASGSGIKDTQSFTTSGGELTLAYTYNCKSFGYKGNFAVTIGGDTFAVAVNELGMSGSDKTYPNLDPGTYNLSINSECKWSVTVTGMP